MIRRLADEGPISYRKQIRSEIGLFFVEKKGGLIRMVLDARLTNFTHRSPAHAALSTPAVWRDLGVDASGLAGAAAGAEACAGGWEGARAPGAVAEGRWFHGAADLADAFYQFLCEELGEDFALNWPATARTYGCQEVYETGAFVPIAPGDFVFPVFVGIPMGWSWALWAVHTTVSYWVGLTSDLSPDPLMLGDKRVAPLVHGTAAVAAVYVDNIVIFGADLAGVERRFKRVRQAFDELGLRLHEIEEPSAEAGPFEVGRCR